MGDGEEQGELSNPRGCVASRCGILNPHPQGPAKIPPASDSSPHLFAYQWLCSSPDRRETKGFTVDQKRRNKNPQTQYKDS